MSQNLSQNEENEEPASLALSNDNLPAKSAAFGLTRTHEGATAFTVDDPLVRLVYNYGSFLPEADTYYGTPEGMMLSFINALTEAATLHPELALQYAAWQRDPRRGKGNRSQPPWAVAVLASLPECLAQPRFAELVARSIVRPDDALNIIRAATIWLGDNKLPLVLKQGVARGLEGMSDYQLAKYANARLNLLPTKKEQVNKWALPQPDQEKDDENDSPALATTPKGGDLAATTPVRTLRLVDVLGICKSELSERLYALYRYLHAPTRLQTGLQPLLESALPLMLEQKRLRASPPQQINEVAAWIEQALAARMTMEQIFAATGMPKGERKQLLELTAPPPDEDDEDEDEQEKKKTGLPLDQKALTILRRAELEQQKIRAEIWKTLAVARVPDEDDPARWLPFLGDVAFLRNLRGMYLSGITVQSLVEEAAKRKFAGLWPFQILSAARQIEEGVWRGSYEAKPCPQVMPVFDTIFEPVALSALPRKPDGSYYRMLGLADISGSMLAQLGSKTSSATCMDAAVSFSVAFSFTTRAPDFGGLAGTWADDFHPAIANSDDGPLAVVKKVHESGGWGGGGTQVFGSMLSLIAWLLEHPKVPRPEVLIVLSDMQFHPPSEVEPKTLKKLPSKFRTYVKRPEFKNVPPLAAAIVLYRELLGSAVSLVLWNLASYEGSPVPSGMERVLMLSGFDSNSLRILETWLQAGSPGTAMPTAPTENPAGSGQSGSSFEAVLAALRQY